MGYLKRQDSGAVRVLVLADPERRNPLSGELVEEMTAALEEARGDDGVRALVITGEPPAFSAGADLGYLRRVRELSAEANLEHSRELGELFYRIYTFPKPVVAAVNGPAIAGGAGLVLASDLAVASPRARIGFTEVRLGFVPALVAVLLVRHLGEKLARELLLGGEAVPAERALEIGLYNRVVEEDRVLEEAVAWAARVAEGSPTSLALTKALLSELPGMGLYEGFAHAALANAWIRQSADLAEGLSAFFEKRRPRF